MTRLQELDKQHKLRSDNELLREALKQIISNLEQVSDPMASIDTIARRALDETK